GSWRPSVQAIGPDLEEHAKHGAHQPAHEPISRRHRDRELAGSGPARPRLIGRCLLGVTSHASAGASIAAPTDRARLGSCTCRSAQAPIANSRAITTKIARYARPGPPAALASTVTATNTTIPPTVLAMGPALATAMLLMPMYRPDSALGMMSVINAQSTPRKTPLHTPIGTAAATTIQYAGPKASINAPSRPSAIATYSTGLRPTRLEIYPPGTA